MATSKKTTKKETTTETESLTLQLAQVRATLEAIGTPEDAIEKALKDITASMVDPIRKAVTDQLMSAAWSVAKSDSFVKNTEILKGSTMIVQIDVDRSGKVSVIERTQSKRKKSTSGGSTGGKRPTLVLNGNEYDSWAALCRAHEVAIGGDSANRAWQRANATDAEKYPMPDEITK